MRIESLRRWHWVVLSLVAGGLVGTMRNQSGDGGLEGIGTSINTTTEFERALFDQVKLKDGTTRVYAKR